jgi:hypothetical protein
MANLILNGSTSGSVTLSSPAVSGTTTLTLPTTSGTVITTGSTFAGTGPAFSVYTNASQTLTSATNTKIQFNTEDYDTNNNFDSTTNYRFTPTVAGYYQLNVQLSYDSTISISRTIIYLYKNGSAIQKMVDISTNAPNITSTTLLYFNGTTDYVEIYGYVSGTGTLTVGGASYDKQARFNGFLARAA